MKHKFKKGDKVCVTSGASKGVVGHVINARMDRGYITVEGVNLRKVKPKKKNVDAGSIDMKVEAPLHHSNVMHVDPKSGLPTKIGMKFVDGKKVRFAKKTGELI